MATSERQKLYNQRYRDKQAKIRRFCKEMDAGVVALEKLPKCPDCADKPVACDHTPERRGLIKEIEMARAQLEQLEH